MMDPQGGATASDERPRVLSRLANFGPLSDGEVALLASSAGRLRRLKRGELIRSEDGPSTCLHLLVEGWAASAVTLASGSRQLVAVGLPGDVLGLPALAVAEPVDAVVALSQVSVREMAVESFARLFGESPRLAALLFLVSQEERAFAMERLALMGGAQALKRLAALFVRVHERLVKLDPSASDRFFMPLTQQDMSDLIGVSSVHMNALIKKLKSTGVVIIKDRELQILDHQALLKIADIAPWRRATPQWLPGPNEDSPVTG